MIGKGPEGRAGGDKVSGCDHIREAISARADETRSNGYGWRFVVPTFLQPPDIDLLLHLSPGRTDPSAGVRFCVHRLAAHRVYGFAQTCFRPEEQEDEDAR